MSVAATTSSQPVTGSTRTRSVRRRSRVAAVRDRVRRQRSLAARRAHEREDVTDGYLDRHGVRWIDNATWSASAYR